VYWFRGRRRGLSRREDVDSGRLIADVNIAGCIGGKARLISDIVQLQVDCLARAALDAINVRRWQIGPPASRLPPFCAR
jgi:hypothetical protein